jgi:hypothetical protein
MNNEHTCTRKAETDKTNPEKKTGIETKAGLPK